MEINAKQARLELTDLLDGTMRGETYTITRNKRPVAALIPVELWEKLAPYAEQLEATANKKAPAAS